MAKKDKKDKKKADKNAASGGAVEAVDAVRSAVERTFAGTAGAAEKLSGDIAVAANRIREVLEDRVLAEIKGLRTEVDGLAKRVSALELGGGSAAKPATARKPAARRPAARKPAARKPAASRSATASS